MGIIILILFFPTLISATVYYDEFSFGMIQELTSSHIIEGKNSHQKPVLSTTTRLELYYGTPFSFLYGGLLLSQPITRSSQDEQQDNDSLIQLNSLSVGLAIGGGYGLVFTQHELKMIFNIKVQIGFLNPYFSPMDSLSQKTMWGTEALLRYQYHFSLSSSFILGIHTGIMITTEEEEDRKTLSGLILSYGLSLGMSF